MNRPSAPPYDGPRRIIEDIVRPAGGDWATLALECGHQIVKPARPKWGRTTSCPKCKAEGRS